MNWMERAKAILAPLTARWKALLPERRRVLLLSSAAFVVLTAVSLWWNMRTDWRVLFRDMDGRDTAQVQQELASAGIPYQSTADGVAIEVAAENLDRARVAIAAKGMPQTGRLGFELFDKPNWAGSEFDERVNYQRALEGELEHTIASMDAVRSARVHLVLPKQGAFSSEDQPAKASVVLTLRRNIDARTQGNSIRGLVASAVEGLAPAGVTLVDADARVDFSGNDTHSASREEEAALEQKLIALLEPLAGAGNVRATVNVSYHTGTEERTDEVYDPNGSVPLTTQRSEQSAQSARPMGVPGTFSNTPALAPAAAKDKAAADPNASNAAAGATAGQAVRSLGGGQASGQGQMSREESSTYAVSHHTSHTEEGAGRVRRISAAVVVNDRPVIEGGAKHSHTVWKARSADEMKRLQQIAQVAVGSESARGDEVVVQNVAFSSNSEEAAPAGMAALLAQGKTLLHTQPSLLRALALGASLLALGLLVLRPLGRQAIAAMEVVPALPARIENAQLLLGEEPEPKKEPAPLPELPVIAAPDTRVFDSVTANIAAEPRNSSRLIEAWLTAGGEGD